MSAPGPWPSDHLPRPARVLDELATTHGPELRHRLTQLGRPTPSAATLVGFHLPLAAWLADQTVVATTPPVVGLSGPPGAGKTTLAAGLVELLALAFDLRLVTLSLDDLYLTRTERRHLARDRHPLWATRGVPGTHDLALGHAVLDDLLAAGPDTRTVLPVFDKGRDDRLPESKWPRFPGRPDLVLLEGWCLGAEPEPAELLSRPVNQLEREEDPDASWRRGVQAAVAGAHAELGARASPLVALLAPSFEQVVAWRLEQETALRRRTEAAPEAFDEAGVRRLLAGFERILRSLATTLPERADVVVTLGPRREIQGVALRG
ncbi:MAG: kinase [Acidobacteriota bacterium]